MTAIETDLFAMQDEAYRLFQIRLMPTVPPETVIGVRTPELRKYAKKIAGTPEADVFLSCLPHTYYEENNLHAFLIEEIRDFERCLSSLDRFLPFVDNWATCDSLSPKVLKKNLPALVGFAEDCMSSEYPYAVRYGIGIHLRYFLGDAFLPAYPERIARIRREEYYIRMMVAWYFATALAKQYDAVLPFFVRPVLPPWVHNKAIQKSMESRRLTEEQKTCLRALKVPPEIGNRTQYKKV